MILNGSVALASADGSQPEASSQPEAGARRRTVVIAQALLRRLVAAAAVMLGAATIAFIALQLIPGNQIDTLLGPNTQAPLAVRQQIEKAYGFNQPVTVQYLHYLGRLAHGNLGQSYQLQQPVSTLIGSQLGPTVQLTAAAMVFAIVIAIASAVATAGRRPGLRAIASAWELVAVSAPSYWVGIVLLTLFSFNIHAFPISGDTGFAALVLPAVSLGLPVAGVLAQVLRESLETALGEPFVVTARARGLSQTAVRLRHALRHAAVPLVTLTGWLTGTLLGGAVVVEAVFGRPGIGSLTLQAVTSKDMPTVIGIVLLSALVFVLISTVVDLLYLLIDPRLRSG
jgi:peptide/nickel transport system permease protein